MRSCVRGASENDQMSPDKLQETEACPVLFNGLPPVFFAYTGD